jgi:hypothetical protein
MLKKKIVRVDYPPGGTVQLDVPTLHSPAHAAQGGSIHY